MGAHGNLPASVGLFLAGDADYNALNLARKRHDGVDLLVLAAGLLEHGARDGEHADAAVFIQLHPLQHQLFQLQKAGLFGFKHPHVDPGNIRAALHQIGGNAEGTRGDVGIAKAARIGGNAGIQPVGNAFGDMHVHGQQQQIDHFARTRGVGLHIAFLCKQAVGAVVVDGEIHPVAVAFLHRFAQQRAVGHVHTDDVFFFEIVLWLHIEKAVAFGHAVGAHDFGAFAQVLQRQKQRIGRAERVAVRVRMRQNQHVLGRLQPVHRRFKVNFHRSFLCRRAFRAFETAQRPAPRSRRQ